MKKIVFLVLSLVLIFSLSGSYVMADRKAPADIEPVIYDDLQIITRNTPDTMGVVEAYDRNTDELIWSTKVYRVKIKKWIEADTQWVFIKSMILTNGRLIITDEKNRVYELDPLTGKKLHKDNNLILPVVLIVSGTLLMAAFGYFIKRQRIKVKPK